MKILKRFSLVLALCLSIMLFACKKKEQTTSNKTTSNTTTSNTTTSSRTSSNTKTTSKTSITKPKEQMYSVNIHSNVSSVNVHTDKEEYAIGDTVTVTGDSNNQYDCVGFVQMKTSTFHTDEVEYVLSYGNTFTFELGPQAGFSVDIVNSRIYAVYAPKNNVIILSEYEENVTLDCIYNYYQTIGNALTINGMSKKENKVLQWFYNYEDVWTIEESPTINHIYPGETYIFESSMKRMVVFRLISVGGETCNVTLNNSNPQAGDVYQAYPVCEKGGKMTIDAIANTGYEFDGWYDGDTLISNYSHYKFTVNNDITLTARWTSGVTPTTYTLTTTNDNTAAGTCTIYTNESFEAGSSVTLTATAKATYAFGGWYNGTTLVSESKNYTFTINSNLTLVARWESTAIVYKLTTVNDNASAGSITTYTNEEFNLGMAITLTATPNANYTFDGWYSGTTRVSNSTKYTFFIDSNLTLVAKWISGVTPTTYTLTTINDYPDAGSITSYTDKEFNENASVTLTATSLDNYYYVFDGWYNGETPVSSANPYTFNITSNLTLTAKWKLMFDTFVDEYNGRPVGGTYTEYSGALFNPNDEIELTATTDPSLGYTFDGWYEWSHYSTCYGRVSENPNFKYKITESVALEARWVEYTVTTKPCYNSGNDVPDSLDYYYVGGDFTTLNAQRITAGQTVLLTATPREHSVTWVGWYKQTGNYTDGYNYTLLSNSETYNYKMTKESVTIVAKFLLYKAVEWDSDDNPTAIEYGYYPQSLVDDDSLKTQLASYVGDYPTSEDNKTWTSYNYYDNGVVSNYMWYKDIDINNDGFMDYRGVYFTKYRGVRTTSETITSGAGLTNNNIYEAGYRSGEVYWFSYDPIVWDIVGDGGAGDKVLVARVLLDSQNWYINTDMRDTIYANNYKESSIKEWLNNNFYYTVFDIYRQKNNVLNLTDNSVASTTKSSNNRVCEDTVDKVYLLSTLELNNYLAGSSAFADATDYAKIQGISVGSNGHSNYWLRSPVNNSDSNAINASGSTAGSVSTNSVTEVRGIRPAIDMML